MKFLKRLFWTLALAPDWYFIIMIDDKIMRPVYWNGVVWEDRREVIEDFRISRVISRVPQGGAA